MSRSKRTHLHTGIYDSDDSTKPEKAVLTTTPSPLDSSKKSGSTTSASSFSSVSSEYSDDTGIYSDYTEDDSKTIEEKHENILKSMFMDFKREMTKMSSSSNRRTSTNGKRNDRYYHEDNTEYLSSSSSSSSDSDFFNDDDDDYDVIDNDDDEESIPSIRTAANKKAKRTNTSSRKANKSEPSVKESKVIETKFCMNVLFMIMNFYMETGCDKTRTQSFLLNLNRENLINEATALKFLESFKVMKLFFEGSLIPWIQSMYRKVGTSNELAHCACRDENGNYCRDLIRMGDNMTTTPLTNELMLLNPENKFKTNFRNIERIGEGSFGKVFKAVNVLDGNTYAVKLVTFKASFNHHDESKIFKILREVNALAKLDHVNVLRYYTCWVEIKESSFVPFGEARRHRHGNHHNHRSGNSYESNGSGSSQDGALVTRNVQFLPKNRPLIEAISSESSINSCGEDEEDTTDEDEIEESEENEEEIEEVEEEEEEWDDDDDIYTEEEEMEEEEEDDDEEIEEEIDEEEEEEEEEEYDELDEIDEDEKLKMIYDDEDDGIEFIGGEEEEEEKIENSVEITDDLSDEEDSIDNAECKQLVLYNHKSRKENSSENSYSNNRHHNNSNNNNSNNNSSLIGSELKFKCILYIQTQYCSGKTLRSLLDDPDWHVSHSQMFPIFHQILLGLEHIHDKGIIHRDLKPANVFLDIDPSSGNYIVKIGDFGLAKVIESHGLQSDTVSDTSDCDCYSSGYSSTDARSPPSSASFSRAVAVRSGSILNSMNHTTMVGTVPYISPEQMSQHEYTTKSDIYSLGIILFEMYNKFSTGSERAFAIRNLRMSGEPSAEMKAKYPLQAELVSMMIAADQNVRPSAKELLVHKNVRELLASSSSSEELMREIVRLRELLAQKDRIIESLTQQDKGK